MLKDKYTLFQTDCCNSSTNFIINQSPPQASEGQSANQLNFASQINSGAFKENDSFSVFNCCSCKNIQELKLSLYGQNISVAHTSSCCRLFPFTSSQMIVTTLSDVLIGIIRKQNCLSFSSVIFTIFDSNNQKIYQIKSAFCQWANLVPKALRCSYNKTYTIIECKSSSSQEKQVGQIINKSLLSQSCFTYCYIYAKNFFGQIKNTFVKCGCFHQSDEALTLLINQKSFIDEMKIILHSLH